MRSPAYTVEQLRTLRDRWDDAMPGGIDPYEVDKFIEWLQEQEESPAAGAEPVSREERNRGALVLRVITAKFEADAPISCVFFRDVWPAALQALLAARAAGQQDSAPRGWPRKRGG